MLTGIGTNTFWHVIPRRRVRTCNFPIVTQLEGLVVVRRPTSRSGCLPRPSTASWSSQPVYWNSDVVCPRGGFSNSPFRCAERQHSSFRAGRDQPGNRAPVRRFCKAQRSPASAGSEYRRRFHGGGYRHTRSPRSTLGRPIGADTSCRGPGSEGFRQGVSGLAYGLWCRVRPRSRKARPRSGTNRSRCMTFS
jgi:hypothetical protein